MKRNRNYENTHRALVEKAVELIAERGAEHCSMSALARAVQINRSTVYYHFESHQELMAAAARWMSTNAARGNTAKITRSAGAHRAVGHTLHDAEAIKLWIGDYMATIDVGQRPAQLEAMVAQIAEAFAGSLSG